MCQHLTMAKWKQRREMADLFQTVNFSLVSMVRLAHQHDADEWLIAALHASATELIQLTINPELAFGAILAETGSTLTSDRATVAVQVIAWPFQLRVRDGSHADTSAPDFDPDDLPFVVSDPELREKTVGRYAEQVGASKATAAFLDELAVLWVSANEDHDAGHGYSMSLFAGTWAAVLGLDLATAQPPIIETLPCSVMMSGLWRWTMSYQEYLLRNGIPDIDTTNLAAFLSTTPRGHRDQVVLGDRGFTEDRFR